MGDHKPVDIDQKQLDDAKVMWDHFTKAGKYAVIVTCVILIGLALGFVKFY